MIEGFRYKSYPPDLVAQILTRYLADTSLKKISLEIDGVSAAGAQRVVDQAIELGVLLPEEKHVQGGGFAIKRARLVWERHPKAKPAAIARLAGCTESTAYRARKSK